MALSTHYYVLVLHSGGARLYEAFRDFLITIENESFPLGSAPLRAGSPAPHFSRESVGVIDQAFGRCYDLEPLRLVVAGDGSMLSAFERETAHTEAIVGRIDGDLSNTAVDDLGRITWSLVKEGLSGVLDEAMRDLAIGEARGRATCGLENVARVLGPGREKILLVEEGYRRRGRFAASGGSPVVISEPDVRDTMDDAVDAVVEKVLGLGGRVVFAPNGSLDGCDRIALVTNDED